MNLVTQTTQTAQGLAYPPNRSSKTIEELHALIFKQGIMLERQRQTIEQMQAQIDKIMQLLPTCQSRRIQVSEQPADLTVRQRISRLVVEYCKRENTDQSRTYNFLYKRLNDTFNINIYRLPRAQGENYLDALERAGHLERLHGLIMAELTYQED